MLYGFDRNDFFAAAAAYIDRILRGKKAASLRVQAPTKYDLDSSRPRDARIDNPTVVARPCR
jgi:hypothetical protein